MKKVILSLDAEADGLWGEIFAIGAGLYEGDEKIEMFNYRSNLRPQNKWVVENVLPYVEEIPIAGNYEDLLRKFSIFYNEAIKKYNVTTLWYGGHVIETHLFRELKERELIDYFDAPYVPIEVGTLLLVKGEDPSTVEGYIDKYNLQKPEGRIDTPLYDAEIAYIAYKHLTKRF